jgi:para-aminobenzoate synthetase component I
MNIDEFRQRLNEWGKNKIPFLFLVDFEMQKPLSFKLSEINANHILYDCNGITNQTSSGTSLFARPLSKTPITFDEYKKKFNQVFKRLEYGDSYLTNLTVRTKLELQTSLRDLFFISRAKYKLWFKNEFLVFSPEIFVRIINGEIFSYPMKGTIDASIPDAREKILNDSKELAEHVTIVDLIRNDLSEVAQNVHVKRFRYIDEIQTSDKKLLQVSSEIVGELKKDFQAELGDLLIKLLPAGSVSGAPKVKTLEIIRDAEREQRGYYTGVFGVFDGKNFDSGVMIRFIEHQGPEYYYRSGGGITTQSIAINEYQEAIDKVYVPVD